MEDTWIAYELHPETPPDGILLSERFADRDLSGFYEHLRQRGQEFGIVFGDRARLSQSRLALMASEYARDDNKFDAFHEALFHAYFTEALDIGRWEVIASIAADCGLDSGQMGTALEEGRYRPRLDEARREGERIGLTGVPTFIIQEKYQIVGAESLDVFTDLFRKIEGMRSS